MRWIVVILMAVGLGALVEPGFHPATVTLDLSRVSSMPAILAGGETVPSRRYPQVMDLYDRGKSLELAMALPAVDGYWVRFKLAFQQSGQQVTVRLNGAAVATFVASKGGAAAEKFSCRIPSEQIRAGQNVWRFEHALPAGTIRYELVEARNYRTELLPGAAYLAFRRPESLAARWQPVLGWLMAGIGLLAIMPMLGGRWLAWVYRTPQAARGWWWLPIPLVALGIVGANAVAWASPYRLILSPWLALGAAAAAMAAQVLLISLPGTVWRMLRGTVTVVTGLGPPARVSVITAITWISRLAWHGARQGMVWAGRVAVLAVRVWLPAIARAVWRWWLRHQSAPGYARFFVYLLGVSGALWLLKARAWADRVSEWAWCALLISCLWYAFRAFRADKEEA